MITHNFTSADDVFGGTWFDDYGRVICKWEWNVETKSLTVVCGSAGRQFDLSGFDAQTLDKHHLRTRLPRLAIEAAEQVNSVRYDI